MNVSADCQRFGSLGALPHTSDVQKNKQNSEDNVGLDTNKEPWDLDAWIESIVKPHIDKSEERMNQYLTDLVKKHQSE